jgi:hypothetical protein
MFLKTRAMHGRFQFSTVLTHAHSNATLTREFTPYFCNPTKASWQNEWETQIHFHFYTRNLKEIQAVGLSGGLIEFTMAVQYYRNPHGYEKQKQRPTDDDNNELSFISCHDQTTKHVFVTYLNGGVWVPPGYRTPFSHHQYMNHWTLKSANT